MKISTEQRWFRAYFLWNSAVQRWIFHFRAAPNQRNSELISSQTAVMFFMFSESVLKNVKSVKQCCSALNISGTSTRACMDSLWHSCNHTSTYLTYLIPVFCMVINPGHLSYLHSKLCYHVHSIFKLSAAKRKQRVKLIPSAFQFVSMHEVFAKFLSTFYCKNLFLNDNWCLIPLLLSLY